MTAKAKIILAIETSCDETALALVEAKGGLKKPRFQILKNIVSSQVAVHRPFGGVVPNLAKREHIKNLPIILKKIFSISGSPTSINYRNITKSDFQKIDLIAVTVGPGLEPALWTGINFAEELAQKLKKPLIGANHLEGHLYSNWLPQSYETKSRKIEFPAIALIVSGGHTILLRMTSTTKWKKLGETLDDAAGEAFDKVAKMLGLPYPGGPEISKLAEKGNPSAVKFPRPLLNPKNMKDKYNFSFSGLKTSVLYHLRNAQRDPKNPNTSELPENKRNNFGTFESNSGISGRMRADIAASFQQAVIDVLTRKTIRAAQEYKVKSILLCGGVAANRPLRDELKAKSEERKVKFVVPDFEFNTDNAAMIAAAAYINLLSKKKSPKLEAQGNLTI